MSYGMIIIAALVACILTLGMVSKGDATQHDATDPAIYQKQIREPSPERSWLDKNLLRSRVSAAL